MADESALDALYGGRSNAVLHPAHYTSHPSGVEVIDLTRHMPFGPGNAVKYVLRRDHKGKPVEDLLKASFYLQDSMSNGVTYTVSEELRANALTLVRGEPNAYVAAFVSSLCCRRLLYGVDVKTPDYESALDLLTRVRRQYTKTYEEGDE